MTAQLDYVYIYKKVYVLLEYVPCMTVFICLFVCYKATKS